MNIRFSRKCVWICATNINHLLYPNKKISTIEPQTKNNVFSPSPISNYFFLLWFDGLFCWCLYFVCVFLLLKFICYSPDQCLLHLFDITSFISVNHICTWKICAFTLAGTLSQLLRHASLTMIWDLYHLGNLQILSYYLLIHGMTLRQKDLHLLRQHMFLGYRPILESLQVKYRKLIQKKRE